MASTAISAQKAALQIATAQGTALNITDITNANPAVVTYSGTPDPSNGDIVVIDGVGGMTQVNGRAFVVRNVNTTAKTFELGGVDATNYGTYTSGGTATPQTMTKIGNLRSVSVDVDEASEIDVTNLDSEAKEFRTGLKGSWNLSGEMDIDPANNGQQELIAASTDANARAFSITLTNGKTFAGVGFVKNPGGFSLSPDDVVKGNISIRGSGEPSWWA